MACASKHMSHLCKFFVKSMCLVKLDQHQKAPLQLHSSKVGKSIVADNLDIQFVGIGHGYWKEINLRNK